MLKMALPFWIATTRRVVNELPSRMRSTSYTIGRLTSPGRKKYACNEWIARSVGTVCTAAEQVLFDLLEREELDQLVEDFRHPAIVTRRGYAASAETRSSDSRTQSTT